MKIVDGIFEPSPTDLRRAEAHARAIARKAQYDGEIKVWFDRSSGQFSYLECVGNSYTVSDDPDCRCVYTASCRSWS